MLSQQDIELIEQYLDNQLPQADRLAFEQRMASDAAFKEAVSLQQLVAAEMADARQLQFLQHLHDVVQTPLPATDAPAPTPQWWWWGGALLLVAGALFFWMNHRQTPTPAPEPPPVNLDQAETTPATPNPEPAPVSPKPSEPIAALNPADYKINRILDPLAGSLVRGGGDISVTLNRPPSPLVLTVSEPPATFLAAGAVTHDGTTPPALELVVFSNKEKDFSENKAIARLPLTLIAQGEPGHFAFKKPVKTAFKPGLYYLVVMEKGQSEPLAVTKIVLNQR